MHLGWLISNNLSGTNPITPSLITFPSSGIWLLSYSVRALPPSGSVTITRFYTSVTLTINGSSTMNLAPVEISASQTIVYNQNYMSNSASLIINVPTITSTTNATLANTIAGGTTTCDNGSIFQIVRIA